MVVLAALTLFLMYDVGGVPSGVLRKLPMADGFRVYARFFPIFMFFVCVLAAAGLDVVVRRLPKPLKWPMVAGILGALLLEQYPARLSVSPVKAIGGQIRAGVHHAGGVVAAIPDGERMNSHDTYQVALDSPGLVLSYLARPDRKVEAEKSRYPLVYGPSPFPITRPWIDEARRVGIRSLLFESPEGLERALTSMELARRASIRPVSDAGRPERLVFLTDLEGSL